MYNLKFYNFGESFKRIRKIKNKSIHDIAKSIDKSEPTVYKYESGEIIPDLLTVLEICNELDIDFNELVNKENFDENSKKSGNPFSNDEMYIYYLINDDVAEYELRFSIENGLQKVKFINPIDSTIFYEGTIESDEKVGYIVLKNFDIVNEVFEKVMIVLNMSYAADNINSGIIVGGNDNNSGHVVKKCVVTEKLNAEGIRNIKKRLVLTEKEKEDFIKNNYWDIDAVNDTKRNIQK